MKNNAFSLSCKNKKEKSLDNSEKKTNINW